MSHRDSLVLFPGSSKRSTLLWCWLDTYCVYQHRLAFQRTLCMPVFIVRPGWYWNKLCWHSFQCLMSIPVIRLLQTINPFFLCELQYELLFHWSNKSIGPKKTKCHCIWNFERFDFPYMHTKTWPAYHSLSCTSTQNPQVIFWNVVLFQGLMLQ